MIRINSPNTGALTTRAALYRDRLQVQLAKDDLERACILGSVQAYEQLP